MSCQHARNLKAAANIHREVEEIHGHRITCNALFLDYGKIAVQFFIDAHVFIPICSPVQLCKLRRAHGFKLLFLDRTIRQCSFQGHIHRILVDAGHSSADHLTA